MTSRTATTIAVSLLLAVSALALASLRGDAAIMDEVSHLPAGFSYVTRADMRLNPEHPPLLKDLAGSAVALWAAITGTEIHFPDTHPGWTAETNGQWTFGPAFLYEANGAAADAMLFWARLPTLLIFLAFGWFLFAWSRRQYGAGAALLTLTLYAFSPTVVAHARYVTTDLGAAAAFFVATVAFLRWLRRPSRGRLVVAGLTLGLAQLVKFSLLLLIPVFAALVILQVGIAEPQASTRRILTTLLRRLGQYASVLAVAFGLVVLPAYVAHTAGLPAAKQAADATTYCGDVCDTPIERFVVWSADRPVLRAAGHYLTGVLLVANRSEFGSATFFRGEVDNGGRRSYFPIVYLVKEPLAFHLLTLAALGTAVVALARRRARDAAGWLRAHLSELSFLLVVASYWTVSVDSALNIGVRHLLPTLPFVFVLVGATIANLLCRLRGGLQRVAILGVFLLLGWQVASVLRVHPSYLAYFNEAAGGPAGGHRIVADSNLDWGQDLKRLAAFVRTRGIEQITVAYFGGGDLEHELPGVGRRYDEAPGPVTGWFAISETFLTFERGAEGRHITKGPNRFAWLDAYEPVATIGHSIVVYDLPAPAR